MALIVAAKNGDVHRVRALLDAGALINERDTQYGWTALMHACDSFTSNLQTIRELLKRKAYVNIQDKYGWTSLMIAACNGKASYVLELLQYGADQDVENNNGDTVINLPKAHCHTNVMNVLLDHRKRVALYRLLISRNVSKDVAWWCTDFIAVREDYSTRSNKYVNGFTL